MFPSIGNSGRRHAVFATSPAIGARFNNTSADAASRDSSAGPLESAPSCGSGASPTAPDYSLDRMNRSDGPEDRGGPERCFGTNMPILLQSGSFGGVARIVQTKGAVSIYYDIGQGQGFSRVIPITNVPHLPSRIRQRWGDARGHWEGDTLVVDVTNFNQRNEDHESREDLD